MLNDILKQEYIKLNVECKNWEEAIRSAGQVLLENDVITNEYIEEAIKEVKELGTYIVITKGVAMPHATSHIGVKKTGIALIKLKEPVEFGNSDNNPVHYVFMLATTDMESHIEALSKVSDLLAKPEFFDVMKNTSDSASFIDYIKVNKI